MKADLHSHTVLSDGALNVDQLISQAKRVGLDYIAVTDHNSTHSIPAVLARRRTWDQCHPRSRDQLCPRGFRYKTSPSLLLSRRCKETSEKT